MTKHISRKQRWTQVNAKRHSSALGEVVYEEKGWYALLDYRPLLPVANAGEPARWESHALRLGPFKRPRNAMVALEQEATILNNRHGKGVLFKDQLWAEG